MSDLGALIIAEEKLEAMRALADRWDARADDYVEPVSTILHNHAARIRAVLDGSA